MTAAHLHVTHRIIVWRAMFFQCNPLFVGGCKAASSVGFDISKIKERKLMWFTSMLEGRRRFIASVKSCYLFFTCLSSCSLLCPICQVYMNQCISQTYFHRCQTQFGSDCQHHSHLIKPLIDL